MKGVLILLLGILLMLGCKEKRGNRESENCDSLVNKYIKTIDSFWFVSSMDRNFQILKAYNEKDTAFLKGAYDSLKTILHYDRINYGSDIVFGSKKLDDVKYEEVYYFTYGAAFCNKYTYITLGRINDTFELETKIMEDDWQTSKIREFSNSKIKLTIQQWDSIISDLNIADFWGLKKENGNDGLDGSSLGVYGIKKSKNDYVGESNSISRWAPERYLIGKLFIDLFKRSNSKVDCYNYEYQ